MSRRRYPTNDMQGADIERRFTYHPPAGDQIERYDALRVQAKNLAMIVLEFTPPTREQSLALTKLEEAIMWANAAIARHEPAAELCGGSDRIVQEAVPIEEPDENLPDVRAENAPLHA
jgi:hypothetical protein